MTDPTADRPHIPDYGIPTSTEGLVPWSWAVELLERALIYSLATAGSDGAPHTIPIWGAWVDGRWYVEGGNTRWQRNLRENPRMAINVAIDADVAIVEGTARELVAPDAPLAERIVAGFAKYREPKGYEASPENWASGGLWELRPEKAFAWSAFPDNVTRFRF
jgi:nitroimidazol reductase NimA-like FMN-containing flavoprotein (pyridoxamine 5'-phosphate oxidase superfamily)